MARRAAAAVDLEDETVSLIELRHVGKVYGAGDVAVQALKDANLAVDESEYVAIMGPSGSGKSTLMYLLGCLDVPTSGQYILNGNDVSQLDEIELATVRNHDIGFVFQQFNLLAGLEAWRNVELPLLYGGERRRHVRRDRAMESLERVGLGHRYHHRPVELSGGEQQRVAIARALINRPALILADEPTGSLDTSSGAEILDLFNELNESGVTIVLITHDPGVAGHAQRLLRIRDGRLSNNDESSQLDSGVGMAQRAPRGPAGGSLGFSRL